MISANTEPLGQSTVTLSSVIQLIDAFTETPESGIVGQVDFTLIRELDETQVLQMPNRAEPSYYVYSDLAAGNYGLDLESTYYFPVESLLLVGEEAEVATTEIRLEPKPDYPYPAGTTLLRGLVVDTDAEPIANALVEARVNLGNNKQSDCFTTKTWNQGQYDGRFTLFVPDSELTGESSIEALSIRLRISHPSYQPVEQNLELPLHITTFSEFKLTKIH